MAARGVVYGMPELMLEPIPRAPSRSERVATSIREAILSGTLKPGEPLVERKLAALLDVSKTPVREALISLVGDGLAEIQPSGAVTVRVLDPATLREIDEVRLRLEPWAIARAAAAADRGALADARAALDAADAAAEAGDLPGLSQANRRFHRALYSACGNPLAISILDGIQDQVALGAVAVLWPHWPGRPAEHGEQHRAILEAVEAGDTDRAEALVIAHLESSAARYRELENDGR